MRFHEGDDLLVFEMLMRLSMIDESFSLEEADEPAWLRSKAAGGKAQFDLE